MSCFDCKKMHSKCGANCCGLVPIPKSIYADNQDKIVSVPHEVVDAGDSVIPLTANATCIFLNSDLSCNIYENRPDICRKFGDESHPMLFCPVLDKNGKVRCKTEEKLKDKPAAIFQNLGYMMNLDINEEEREFLQRICTRAELFCRMNIWSPSKNYSDFEKDLVAVRNILQKLNELDANKMKKVLDESA